MADEISPFGRYLGSCEYVMALVGAGLSASSGIPTFRDQQGAYWRNHTAISLATRSAFARDPVLVWQFYEHRRKLALNAQPNAGHFALVRLAERKPYFLTITQNIDNLSQRAGHDPAKLAPLHGSLFATKCFDQTCSFSAIYRQAEPLVPALRLPDYDVSDPASFIPSISAEELPRCPKCSSSFLRPGVVWFGERMPEAEIARADEWLAQVPRVDLLLVVGTSSRVFPAAEYIEKARAKGACIAHFNLERDDDLMCAGDWFIPGDVAETLPRVVAEAIDGLVSGVPGDEAKSFISSD